MNKTGCFGEAGHSDYDVELIRDGPRACADVKRTQQRPSLQLTTFWGCVGFTIYSLPQKPSSPRYLQLACAVSC